MGTTLKLGEDLAERLKRLSKITEQSESSLISQATEEFLTVLKWQVQTIKEGIEAADREDFVNHEESIAELKTWNHRIS